MSSWLPLFTPEFEAFAKESRTGFGLTDFFMLPMSSVNRTCRFFRNIQWGSGDVGLV